MMNNYNSLSYRVSTWLKNGIGDSGGSPPLSRSRSKWFALLLFLFIGISNYGQTTLISPTGDGGFENGTTLAANNWTAINSSTDSWTAGNTPGVSAGARSAFISSTAGTTQTWTYSQISTIQHLYYDVTIPAGESIATLTFKWKAQGEGTTTSDWDNMRVFWGTVADVGLPVANTALPTGLRVSGAGAISGMYKLNSAAYNSETITLSGTPGTTYRLVFSWKSDGSDIVNPPAAIDEVSLVSRLPILPDAAPISFTATAVTQNGMTVNWVDNSTNETTFRVLRSTDNVNFVQIGANITSTSVATTGTAYNSVQTGLTPGTTYYYRIVSAIEGFSANLTGTQATPAATTYYYVGAGGTLWSAAASWNTAADGSGTNRTTPTTTDILVVDGTGTVPGSGGTMAITVDNSFTIGQLVVNSNTNLTLAGLTSTRTLTISGSPGDDFVVASGSTLNLNGATAVAIVFTGTGNTGLIAGTYNVSGSTSNNVTSTGGTGTLVTVTGSVNNSLLASSGCLTGSVATLSFANGSNYTHSSFTTSNGYVPTATWGTTSNIFITGGTTSTALSFGTGSSFGNFTYNSATSTATFSAFTTGTTTVIKGDLNILATNTGRFRALTSGTLTVQGNLNVSGGNFEVASSTGTLIVNGNVNASAGTFDVAQGGTSTLRVLGNFVQSGTSSIIQTSTGSIEFAGTVAQDLTLLTGAHGTNAVNVRVNNAAGVNLTADMSIRNLTVSNGGVTGAGNLVYGATSVLTYNGTTAAQTISAKEFPSTAGPASLTINNTTASPNNTVTLGFARSLGATGTLTLTSGILDNGTNALSILNPAVAAVSGGSATTYVKGDLSRDLTSGLVSGSTYNFPVGLSGYNPFALVNPTTNAGAPVSVKVSVSDTPTGGTPSGLLASINPNRSWLVDVTDSSSNFTGSLVRLTDTTGSSNAIGYSADGGLTYNLVGGLVATVTGTAITSTAPAAASVDGYFAMATKADPPVLSALAITPTGNQCTNVSRDVTITVTPGAAAVTGVVINYSVNGTPQTAVAMSNTSGNNWAGTIPTVTPANATVTWSVTATDANAITANQSGTSYADEPNLGTTPTASISLNTICNGGTSSLTASLIGNGTAIVGAGGTTSSSTAASFFPGAWGGAKTEYIIRASELTAAGLTAGAITSLGFDVTTVGQTYQGFRVQVGHTSATAMTTTFLTGSMTQVYLGTLADDGYLPTLGVNTLAFGTGAGSSSSFVWDGTSNVVVSICWSRVPSASTSTSTTMRVDATGFTSSAYEQSDSSTPAVMCAKTTADGTGTNRPQFRLGGVVSLPISSVSWSDGLTEVGTTNPLSVSPSSSQNYTASFTANGCPLTTNSVALTVNPLPTAPTGTDSTQCGSQVPTASVADVNAFSSPTFNWYADNVTTTALQSSTATTFAGSISETTIFYVSVVNPTTLCESTRTAVTVSVDAPQAITVTPGATGTVCQNGTITLGASSAAGYTYTWTASPEAGSGITGSLSGASVDVTPTGVGPYVYTVTGIEGSCTTTNTITVTLTPAPSITIEAPAGICPDGSATLTAETPVIAAGSVTLGAGGSTSSSTAASFFPGFWGGAKTEYIVRASELTAAGLAAGAITSLGFDVTAVGQTYQGFRVQIGHTSATDMTTTFLTDPLTQVYLGTLADDGYLPTVGVNTLAFGTGAGSSSSFVWDGTSNIVVSICWSRVPSASTSTSSTMKVDATGFTSSAYRQRDSLTPAAMCSETSALGTGTNRPQFIFAGQAQSLGAGTLVYTWDDPLTTTGNVLNVSPSETTTYTVSGFDSVSGCTGIQTATVMVNTPPTAPTATNSSQCAPGVPTATVADTNSFAAPIYNWYADNTATTALQSGASATFTTSVSETTIFYVSVTSLTAGCESERTPVTVTVNTPATISVSSDVAVCAGDTTTLTASVVTGTISSYAWSPATGLSATTGTSVDANPSATTTYSVVGTDSNNCTTASATVTVTVNQYPSSVTISQTPSSLCSGSIATLTANGGTVGASGSGTIGTATTLTGAIDQPTAFNNRFEHYWMQLVFTPAELAAAGIQAGNITSIAFNIDAQGSANNVTDFKVRMGSSPTATLSAFQTSGLTEVYAAPVYNVSLGVNTITFTAPYAWDGISNVLVDVRNTGIDAVNNTTTYYTATTGSNTVITAITTATFASSDAFAASNPTGTTSVNRLNTTFNFNAVVPTSYIWSPTTNLFTDSGATTPYTGGSAAVVYTNTTSAQTYTVSVSNGECGGVSDEVTVTPNPVPVFTVEDISICNGGSGDLTAVSAGTNGYSWTPVGGGTTLTGLSVSVSPTVTTVYDVTATDNVTNCQTTQQVTVTVNDPGSIVSGTTTRSVSPDQPTTFEVVASGTSLTYQWQVNDNVNGWVDITDDYVDETTGNYSDSNTAILSVQNITIDFDTYQYQCIVTGAAPCAPLTPIIATLSVTNTGFSTQPTNVTLCDATSTEFTIVTTGDEPGFVQWQVSTDDGASFTDIVDGFDPLTGLTFAGANDFAPKTLTVSGITTANDGYLFQCQLDFFLNSNVALLTVNTPVQIVTNPDLEETVCYTGGSTTFNATASGDYSSIQWQYSADGISGWASVVNGTPAGATYTNATTNTLGVTTTTGGYYRANFVGTSPCANVASNAGQILINTPNVGVTASSTSFCLPSGNAITLTASGASTYTWSPATGLSATTGESVFCSPSATTTYIVTGNDGSGCLDTASVTITVGSDITATASATPALLCSGTNSQLDVAVTQVTPTPFGQLFTFQTLAGTYVPLAGGTASTAIGDDGTQNTIPIGFNFTHGGTSFTTFSITTNGTIRLGATATGFTNALATNSNVIAPLWDDNHLSAGTITYSSTGTAPNRVLTVQWANVSIGGDGSTSNSTNNYQVQLFESDNSVRFNYGTLAPNVMSASIGITAASGSYLSVTPTAIIANSTVSSTTANNAVNAAGITNITNGTSYLFTPIQLYTYSWSPSTFIEGQTSLKNPVATGVTSAIEYTVTVSNVAGCSANATAAITLDAGPVITTQPSPLTVTNCQGAAASFTVVATGPSLTYQWRKDGEPITGNPSALTATLNLTGTTPASSGSYDVVVTACTISVTSDAVALTVHPTPVLTTTLAAASYCVGATVPSISLVGTPSGVTYDVTGGAAVGLVDQLGVTTIPSFTATTGNATITVTPNANGCPGTAVTYTVTVNALPTDVTVTPASQTICSNGTPVLLTATGGIATSLGTIGTGTSVIGTTSYPNVFSAFYGGTKHQMIYTAAELTTLGLSSGSSISSLALNIAAFAPNALTDLTIRMKNTSTSVLTGFESGTVAVYGPQTFTPSATGWATFNLSSSFTWTGGNIIVEFVHNAGNGGNGSGTTTRYTTTTGFNRSYHGASDNVAGGIAGFDALTSYSVSGASSSRANLRLAYSAQGNVTWSPTTGLFTDAAGNNAYTGTATATVYARPTTTTSYIATATSSASCPKASLATEITVNTAPTVSSSYACSGTSFTANAVPGSAGSYSYAWTVPSGAADPGNVASFVSSTPGVYTVTLNDLATGCSASSSFTVTYTTLYQDSDGDGYGNLNVSIVGCSQSGYVLNSTDCDDTIAAVNPGAAEVPYDGIDNDCDTVLDNGFAPFVSTMLNCGTTLSSISSLIACYGTANAVEYRFEITGPNGVQTIDRPYPNFSLTSLATYDYATTYSVRVMLRRAGQTNFVGYYGTACLYSTPAVTSPVGGPGSVQLQTYCDGTLPSISTLISTTSLSGATGYRFRVTNTLTGDVQTLDRSLNWFSLTMLQRFHYGTTYVVDVAVKTTELVFPANPSFGASCTVTTPALPSLTAYCDSVVPTKGTNITTASLNRATLYKFEVTRYTDATLSTIVDVSTLDRTQQWFTFNNITNYSPNTYYSVRVSVMTSGTFPESATPGQFLFGDACVIQSPSIARETELVETSMFEAVGYPNPYDYEFGIKLNTTSDSIVSIKVYDMVGKLIEQREVRPTDIPVQAIGERFPTGVYNVVVSQDGNAKSLRMIKR